jgi:hypothetical protein
VVSIDSIFLAGVEGHLSHHIFSSVTTSTSVNIVLEVRDNEHSLMRPTDRGNDPTVIDNDETERGDRERGTESSTRDGNGPLHDYQWTLVRNPRRAWKKGNRVIRYGLV